MKAGSMVMLALLVSAPGLITAQEFKVSKSTGKLVVHELNDVTIEGHAGNEIIFTSLDGPKEKDRRAEGLRVINSVGLEDNTGLGLAVKEEGNNIEVYQLKKMRGPRIKIQVPKGVSVSLTHSSPYGGDVRINNVEGEIEVSTVHNPVHLDNVTGPVTVKTVHGRIEAVLPATVKSPVSLASVHGLVDVTLPVAIKATLNLSTSYGEIYVDNAFKIEMEQKSDLARYGSNKVNGKVNGGGIDLSISSSHSNIYLRRKQ